MDGITVFGLSNTLVQTRSHNNYYIEMKPDKDIHEILKFQDLLTYCYAKFSTLWFMTRHFHEISCGYSWSQDDEY